MLPISEVAGMNNDTILKMQKMRLPALVQNYREQLEHPELYDSMTFAERVALMVDAEYDTRENNKIKRLLKQSSVPESTAHMADREEIISSRHLPCMTKRKCSRKKDR